MYRREGRVLATRWVPVPPPTTHRDICQVDGVDDALDDDDDDSHHSDDNLEMDNVSDTTHLERINNENGNTCNEHSMSFILTNARSLAPKFDSMVDAFESLGLDFLCVTETWFKGGKELAEALRDLQGKSGLSIIHKSRDGRGRTRGGGVAVVFNSSSCNFKRRALGPAARGLEIV